MAIMNWSDVLADPSLQDLPYKIELNGYGQIVMSPASNRHARFQGEIIDLLLRLRTAGKVIVECSVDTNSGVKVPDVAWLSDEFVAQHADVTPFPQAPELCVEVCSPSNSPKQLKEKRQLYFAQGAQEVWLCNEKGNVEFFAPPGPIERSALFPAFPTQID
jgi:Uma2 family endonuclease